MKRHEALWIACSLAAIAMWSGCASPEGPSGPATRSLPGDGRLVETRVKEIATPPGDVKRVFYSDDGEHVAWIVAEQRAMRVVHDGVAGPIYETVDEIVFSPDGGRLAYRAGQGDKQFIVCDGKEGKHYRLVSEPIFSPDGKRLACVASEKPPKPKYDNFVVYDGVEYRDHVCSRSPDSRTSPRIRMGPGTIPCFSPDSRHLVYTTMGNGGMRLLIDGIEGPPHVFVSSLAYLPDRLRFAIQDDGVPDRVVDVNWPGLSPDQQSEAAALLGRLGDKQHEVREGATQRLIAMGPGVRPLVKDAHARAVDPEVQMRCDLILKGVSTLRERVVRVAAEGVPRIIGPNGEFVISGPRPLGSTIVVTKEGELKVAGQADVIVFSPDGRRYAYPRRLSEDPWSREGRSTDMILDGEVVKPTPSRNVTFSPDSRHFAYAARRDGNYFVVCDGRETPREHHVTSAGRSTEMGPFFSPDSRHLAYGVLRGGEDYIVCDGIKGPTHDWARIPTRYDKTAGKLRYLARDGDRTWLVEVDWPKDVDWTNGLVPIEVPGAN